MYVQFFTLRSTLFVVSFFYIYVQHNADDEYRYKHHHAPVPSLFPPLPTTRPTTITTTVTTTRFRFSFSELVARRLKIKKLNKQ